MKKIDINTLKTLGELEAEWMKDPEFVKEWQKVEPEYQLARQIIGARLKKKMTQSDLAKQIGTDQAVISRLEGMGANPSLSLIQRIAAVIGPLTLSFN